MGIDAGELELLERRLDDFDEDVRREALARLIGHVDRGEIFLPPEGIETNVHSHTFFSYNAYGYSPSGFIWRARRRGLAAAGTVDFDVLDGLEETIRSGEALGLRAVAGLETRVFIPVLSRKEINSPREPGIYYFMGTAFGRVPAPDSPPGRTLAHLRELAQRRNREIMERVNRFLGSVALEYERDVLPLTPSRNPTERHLLAAYDRAARAAFGDGAPAFWAAALAMPPAEIGDAMRDTPRFHELLRARLMKFGSPGYAAPEAGSFPTLAEAAAMVRDAGGLPTATWLDGTSEGEAALEDLLDLLEGEGVVILNIIPERNWNIRRPEEKREKLENLARCIAACRARGLPVIAGTEMNRHGQPFVDSFSAPELAPYARDFLDGAVLAYGHGVAARHGGRSYSSPWAEASFGPATGEGRLRRNDFYRRLGSRGVLARARREAMAELGDGAAPAEVLGAAGVGD